MSRAPLPSLLDLMLPTPDIYRADRAVLPYGVGLPGDDDTGEEEPWTRFVTPEMSNSKLDQALHYIDNLTDEYYRAGMEEKAPDTWLEWMLFRVEFRKYYDDQYNSVFDAPSVYSEAENYIKRAKAYAAKYEKLGWHDSVVPPELPTQPDPDKPNPNSPLTQTTKLVQSATIFLGLAGLLYLGYTASKVVR